MDGDAAPACPMMKVYREKEDVSLDPDTAHPSLALSEDRRQVTATRPHPAAPDAPGRFDVYACVLGAEGYTAGTHFWDVQVPGAGGWALGVTRASAGRKGRVPFSPEHGTWAIQLSMGQYRALSGEWVPLAPPRQDPRVPGLRRRGGGFLRRRDHGPSPRLLRLLPRADPPLLLGLVRGDLPAAVPPAASIPAEAMSLRARRRPRGHVVSPPESGSADL